MVSLWIPLKTTPEKGTPKKGAYRQVLPKQVLPKKDAPMVLGESWPFCWHSEYGVYALVSETAPIAMLF